MYDFQRNSSIGFSNHVCPALLAGWLALWGHRWPAGCNHTHISQPSITVQCANLKSEERQGQRRANLPPQAFLGTQRFNGSCVKRFDRKMQLCQCGISRRRREFHARSTPQPPSPLLLTIHRKNPLFCSGRRAHSRRRVNRRAARLSRLFCRSTSLLKPCDTPRYLRTTVIVETWTLTSTILVGCPWVSSTVFSQTACKGASVHA